MIKKIFVKILKKLDLKILKISKNKNSVELLVKLIQKKNISLVFDIGANTGQFAKKLRDENYKKKIISFEPLKKEHEQMKKDSKDDQNWDIYDRCAVGEINGEIKLNISNYSPSSSILDFHKNHKKAREDTYMNDTDTVKIFKLDTIVDKLKLDTENVLIKIDTQGYENKIIIGADRILSNDFTKLNNVTIYNLDQNFNFIKRYDIKNVLINEKEWILKNTKILINDANLTSNKEIKNLKLTSSIDISSLKSFFLNVDTISFWEILKTIKKLNSRGYGGEELKAKLHKYLSLPLYLFGTILVSTMFTIGMKKQYNTFMYLFFGIIVGFLIYFLNDLSVAIGLSNKLPLIISVWSPIMLIIILGSINLIKINE